MKPWPWGAGYTFDIDGGKAIIVKILFSNTCRSFMIRELLLKMLSWGWCGIKMLSYQYRNSHCGYKMIWRLSDLYNGISFTGRMTSLCWIRALAPVPLSIFRSNSKFDENSERFSFEYTWPITTIFCTRHDSDTVVTCAKYRCDRPRIFYTRVFWTFIEFRIRSKYA